MNPAEKVKYNSIRQQVVQSTPRYLLELIMVLFVVLLVIIVLKTDSKINELVPILGIFGVAAIRLMPSANMLSGSIIQLRFSLWKFFEYRLDFV